MTMDKVLVIVDAQVDMFIEGAAVYEAEGLLERLSEVIARARQGGTAVIFIQNNGSPGEPDEPGTPGWEIHPRLAPEQGEPVLQKDTADAFESTPLQDLLAESGVRELIIAGLQTEYCVQATVQGAVRLGYAVTLIADGHSTYDDELPAKEIIDQYNRQVAGIVQVTPAEMIRW